MIKCRLYSSVRDSLYWLSTCFVEAITPRNNFHKLFGDSVTRSRTVTNSERTSTARRIFSHIYGNDGAWSTSQILSCMRDIQEFLCQGSNEVQQIRHSCNEPSCHSRSSPFLQERQSLELSSQCCQ
jgi:hypothetical protein